MGCAISYNDLVCVLDIIIQSIAMTMLPTSGEWPCVCMPSACMCALLCVGHYYSEHCYDHVAYRALCMCVCLVCDVRYH